MIWLVPIGLEERAPMKNLYVLTLVFFYPFLLAQGQLMEEDLDDEQYEKYIYNIYKKHYAEPVSNSAWNQKLQSLPKQRKLKHRDNMWDISKSHFQNPLYWSKLWVANPQVENPHLIYRGDFLKFDPLSLSRVHSSEHSVDIQSQFPGLTVPQQEQARGALKEAEIPSSLPKINPYIYENKEMDLSQLQATHINKRMMAPSYLTSQPPSKVGQIISRDGYGDSMSVKGDNLIVKIKGSVSIGSVFTVFENRGRVGSLFQFIAGVNEDEIIIKGKLKILSYLQGEDSLYIAEVMDTLRTINPGDSLFSGPPPFYIFSQKGPIGRASGTIIGAFYRTRSFLDLGAVVYLDKGSADGIQREEIFYIRGKEDKRAVRHQNYNFPVLGKLKIIHVAGMRSTAVVIESRHPLYIGDIFSGEIDQLKDLSESPDHEEFDSLESSVPLKEKSFEKEPPIEDEEEPLTEDEEEPLTEDEEEPLTEDEEEPLTEDEEEPSFNELEELENL